MFRVLGIYHCYEDKLFMLLPMQAKQFEVSAAKNCAILSEAKK